MIVSQAEAGRSSRSRSRRPSCCRCRVGVEAEEREREGDGGRGAAAALAVVGEGGARCDLVGMLGCGVLELCRRLFCLLSLLLLFLSSLVESPAITTVGSWRVTDCE